METKSNDIGDLNRALEYVAKRTRVFSQFVEQSRDWRRRGIAFFAGGLSVLALAPFFIWPVLFVTLPVLVWLLDSCEAADSAKVSIQGHGPNQQLQTIRAAAYDGWWFGFGYFALGLYWVGEAFLVEAYIFGWLMPVAVALLAGGLAIFYALAAIGARMVWPQGFARILVLAVALAASAWFRGHVFTGFPWNVLGYAFTYPLAMMQSASLTGVYGLTLWVVVACASPLVVIADTHLKKSLQVLHIGAGLLIAIVPLAAMFAFGAARIANGERHFVDGVKIRLVQPSVPQRDKWLSEKQSGIFAEHLALSKQDPNGFVDDATGITHIVWPEASMPFLPLRHPRALQDIGSMLPDSAILLAGALRVENHPNDTAEIPYDDGSGHDASGITGKGRAEPRAFNSLMVFDGRGSLVSVYDKTHLVPFGEYLPYRSTLEAIGLRSLTRLRGGFEIGVTPRPILKVPGLPDVGGLICYEAIFPGAAVQTPTRPSVLVNVTNDGWFGSSTGPYQHFHQARVRAVEEGLPLIRSANNGISAIIDPFGRVSARIGLDVRATADGRLPVAQPPTVYARLGDIVFVLNAIVFGFLACGLSARQKLWRAR